MIIHWIIIVMLASVAIPLKINNLWIFIVMLISNYFKAKFCPILLTILIKTTRLITSIIYINRNA